MNKPILFSGPMVRALLNGRKTQTRRVLKLQPDFRGGCGDYNDAEEWGWEDEDGYHVSVLDISPNGFRTGDRLWVREGHALLPSTAYAGSEGVEQSINPRDTDSAAIYREGFDRSAGGIRWRPSIHLPRWASRLTLIVSDVRVHRLQEISEVDAIAEGVEPRLIRPVPGDGPTATWWFGTSNGRATAKSAFRDIWDSLNDARGYGWISNPWVVALTFTVRKQNIDQIEAVEARQDGAA